jgi:hypothetical protein
MNRIDPFAENMESLRMGTDLYQSPGHQEILRQAGWIVEDLGGGQVGYVMRLKILPFVSVMALVRVEDPMVLESADQIAREYRSLVVRVAPRAIMGSKEAALWEEELRAYGYSWDTSPLVPPKTFVLDLSLSEMELLTRMKYKTRYNIKLSQRKGTTTKVVTGSSIASDISYLDEFYALYRQNCQRIGIKSMPRKIIESLITAHRENAFVIYAYTNTGELGAVETFIVNGDTISTQYTGSTEEGRRDFATNLVVWEGIREGKRRGCKWFDFEGFRDERYPKLDKAYKGFSRFKAGFGGQEVTYMGTYIKRLPFLKKARAK